MTLDFSRNIPLYSELMEGGGTHIRLKLDTDEPIALSDFVGSFVGIGNQFDRFVATEYPALKGDSEVFVQDVRDGCVVADLIVLIGANCMANSLPGVIESIDKAQVLGRFVEDVKKRLGPYLTGARTADATKPEIRDWLKTVAAIARDPKAGANLEAATFEDGKRKIRAALKFSSAEAREAQRSLEAHRQDLESKGDADHERVLLQFVRPSAEAGKPGKKGGERGIIASLHPKARPIVYASDLAEQRMRHEMLEVDHVFRRLFDVDVKVETNAAGKPLAYRITAFHISFDPSDSEDVA